MTHGPPPVQPAQDPYLAVPLERATVASRPASGAPAGVIGTLGLARALI